MRAPPLIISAACNVAAALVIILGAKHVYATWPFPVMATSIQMLVTWTCMHGTPPLDKDGVALNYLAILFAMGVAGANMSLRLNTVGTYELYKSTQIPMLLCIQLCQFKVRETRWGVAAAVAIMSFVALGTLGSSVAFSLPGLLAAMASTFSAAAFKVMIKVYHLHMDADTDALLYATLPRVIVLMGAYAALLEHATYPKPLILAWILGIGVAATVLNRTAFTICGSSPMLYQALAPVKTFMVVMLSNSWGDTVRTIGIAGAVLGSLGYLRCKGDPWSEAPQRSLEYLTQVGRSPLWYWVPLGCAYLQHSI